MPLDLVADVRCRFGRARAFECIAQHAVHSHAGKDRLLHRQLIGATLIEASADLGVITLVVLPDDEEIDVCRSTVGQRRAHPREQADRTQIHILTELPAYRNQQPPERHVVRHTGVPDRAQKNRIEPGQIGDRTLTGHTAGTRV